jgi:hypothetical protein
MTAVRTLGLVMALVVGGGCVCLPGGEEPDPAHITATVDGGGVPVVVTNYGGVPIVITVTNHTGAELPTGVTANVTSPATVGVEGVGGGTCTAALADGATCTVNVTLGVDASVPLGSLVPVEVTVGKGGYSGTATLQLDT